GKQAEAKIRVLPAAVASVNVVAPEPIIAGGKLTLVAQVKDARGKAIGDRDVKWSSSSPAIAIVTRDGTVTGRAAGLDKVTAEVGGQSWTVSVPGQTVPAATVTIEGPSDPLAPGLTATLQAVVKDAKGLPLSGREVQWSSSTPKVAAVTGQEVV